MSGRALLRAGSLFSFCLFFLYLSSSSSPLPFSLFSRRHLPTSAHLQGTNIWEMQFEHFSATKERQTMLEKRGDKHAADLMLDKHVALPPIHKWPCYVQRSQVWKFKDKLDCACGRCCCLFAWRACLSIVWQIHSLRDDRRGMMLLKDENKENYLQRLNFEEAVTSEAELVKSLLRGSKSFMKTF